jgi:hemolysin III
MLSEAALQKPLLRGVSHQIAFFVAIVGTIALVALSASALGRRAGLAFGATLVTLFGTSALYHRVSWTPVARQRMRRLDHSAIFLLIAGGYTPIFTLVASKAGGHGALAAVWLGAGLGVLKSLLFPNVPKWVTALVCVGIGWMVVGQVIDRVDTIGMNSIYLLVFAGVTYSLGALVYAAKRPDPWPRVFGYHEVFHLLVVLASCALYAHVAWLVHNVPG